MEVIDPGHKYLLDSLDGPCEQTLTFVKREGPKYPGNVGSYPGTTIQEVLRVLINRLEYVNNQLPCFETQVARESLIMAIGWLERRAARIHGRKDPSVHDAVYGEKCPKCGHVGCQESCDR